MQCFLYLSRCHAQQFSVEDLEIMRCALANNEKHNITGFLHRNRTHYFQYFEGHRAQAQTLMANIQADKRHVGCHVLMSEGIERRLFGDWSMGYSQPSGLLDGVPQISANDSAQKIIKYLTDEADRQKFYMKPSGKRSVLRSLN